MRLLRMLGIGLGMLLAIGFGLCGAYGVVVGGVGMSAGRGEGAPFGWIFIAFGLLGLAFAAALVQIVRMSLKEKRDAGPSKEQ